LAGVVVALVAQLILNLIGIGIGASTLSPGAGGNENPSAEGFSIGAAIWWTAWAATTLIVFYLLSSAIGGVIGGAYRGLTDVTGGVASATGGIAKTTVQAGAPSVAATPDPFSKIEQSIKGATGTEDPTAMRDAAVIAVKAAVSGDQQEAAEARTRAADALAKAQNIPVEEAQARVSKYEQEYRQGVDTAKQKTTEAAAVATKAVSRLALVGALALLLGGVAAWFGGRMGAVDPTVTQMGRLPPAGV
jgi:hypothetical protein